MTQMKSNMVKLEEELSLFKVKRSETNPHVNTRSVVKQTNKNIESTTDVLVTKKVRHEKLQNTIFSKGNNIQNEEINLKCQFCSNRYKTDRMLRRHMNAKHGEIKSYDLCKKKFKN